MGIHRVEPALPAEHMQTYGLVVPLETHWRPATCEEVVCTHHANGWQTAVDEATELGQRQAHYIRRVAGRAFTEAREGALTVFRFPAGQVCFGEHRRQLERDPVFFVRDGDWRGNPRGTPPRVHARGADWVEDMQENLDKTRAFRERG